MNKVILMGNLTRDVELKTSQGGTTFARTGIAVTRPFHKDETDFFNLVAFGKTAEFLGKYFAKGRRILIEGVLRQSTYEDKEGNKKSTVEVVIDNVEFADDKKSSDGTARKSNSDAYRSDDAPLEDPPF